MSVYCGSVSRMDGRRRRDNRLYSQGLCRYCMKKNDNLPRKGCKKCAAKQKVYYKKYRAGEIEGVKTRRQTESKKR